jgi:hypothetical protein
MVGVSFLLVPFDYNSDGKLQPGPPRRLPSMAAARTAGRRGKRSHAGFAIIEDRADATIEPRLMATFGRISDETLAIFDREAAEGKVIHLHSRRKTR